MFFKKKEKTIPEGKYRIIKIGKDALFEFIYESMLDNQGTFFDVTDTTKIVTTFDINWDTGELICLARNDYGEGEHLQCDIDTQKLISKLNDTTGSLYNENRYIEVSKDEINKL